MIAVFSNMLCGVIGRPSEHDDHESSEGVCLDRHGNCSEEASDLASAVLVRWSRDSLVRRVVDEERLRLCE